MKKAVVALMVVAVLGVLFSTPALADPGGQPNDASWWGQAHKDEHAQWNDKDGAFYYPASIGWYMNGQICDGGFLGEGTPGKKDIDPPPWGPGGIQWWWQYGPPY